jgi:hypothetical protein
VGTLSKEERMNENAFDTLSRRVSLVTVGAAGLAAFGSPLAAGAGKNKKKKKGDVNKLCKKQVAQCDSHYAKLCRNYQPCLAASRACCALLGTCNFYGTNACAANVPPPPPQ